MPEDLMQPRSVDLGLPAPEPVTYRDVMDVGATRNNIYDGVFKAVQTRYPMQNDKGILSIENLRYDGPSEFNLAEQKKAVLQRSSLDRKLKGTWTLRDKTSGQVLDQQDKVVARVPYLTERGTFIYRGNEWNLASQQRLRAGVYSRKKDNGDLETHVNLLPGTGSSFRVNMEPKTGLFRIQVGQSNLPIYRVLQDLGATSDEITAAWGADVHTINRNKNDPNVTKKVFDRLADSKTAKAFMADPVGGLKAVFAKMEVDPEITKLNLGKAMPRVDKEVLLKATAKLMAIHRGEVAPDDRDSQSNLKVYGPEDLISERITKDAGQTGKNLLWKATNRRNLAFIPSQALTSQIMSAVLGSGLGSPTSQVNAVDIMDQIGKVSRLGEGGMGNADAIPDSSRNVSASQLGFVDPIKSPESGSAGVDARFAVGVERGSDGQLYRTVSDVRTGKPTRVSVRQALRKVFAFPGEMESGKEIVRALKNERITLVRRGDVDFSLPQADDMFSAASNLVPGFSGIKGQRMSMGSRMIAQALALKDAEAPLVRSGTFDGGSYEALFGKRTDAVFSPGDGVVTEVSPDSVSIKTADGVVKRDLYNNHPLNQKSSYHSTVMVKPGDTVGRGQILAKGNYTDKEGVLALGRNLRVAYLPFDSNYEDAMVISESAAKKLTSVHSSPLKFDAADGVEVSRDSYVSLYPGRFNRDQVKNVGADGVVKPGTVVKPGDPLVLAVGTRRPRIGEMLHRSGKSFNSDQTMTWDHDDEGVVTDTYRDENGAVKVHVKYNKSSEVADKFSNRFGAKGVVSRIVPDDKMPRDKDGNSMEVILNPLGTISRVNSTALAEVLLGKIAAKTGKPYNLRNGQNLAEFALSELSKNGIDETEELFDPTTNRKLKGILTGNTFLMKLHHVAEGKAAARDTGSYTSDDQPAKGGSEGAKRFALMDLTALLSSGGIETLKDAKLIRGQRNDKFWEAYRSGGPVKLPGRPFVYDKFLNMLRGAGVNISDSPDSVSLRPVTKADIAALNPGLLTSGDAVNLKDESPVRGGIFDRSLTGGHGGNRWSAIALPEPMLNPVMESPARRLLGMTKPKFEETLFGPNGPEEIRSKLDRIDIDRGIEEAKREIRSGRASKRDEAVKRLHVLAGAKSAGIHPRDWIWDQFPVIPPAFRPVNAVDGMQLTSDSNLLYKDIFEAAKNLTALKGVSSDLVAERKAVWETMKAAAGTDDPVDVKHIEKGVSGLLEHVFGKSSPKYGLAQRKLFSQPVDVVSRGVAIPDHSLNMDEIGVPEEMAWKMYSPMIMRRLARRYNQSTESKVPLSELSKWVTERDPRAKSELLAEMDARPVIMHRAPVLHRYGIMAWKPVLKPGNSIRVSPLVTKGLGLDFDGDTINIHVPVSDKAVTEAKTKLMPSQHLRSTGDFKVHYLPQQEFLLGLFTASTAKARDAKPRRFASQQDVVRAYRRGDIDLDESVTVD